jgi:hypothetical protein
MNESKLCRIVTFQVPSEFQGADILSHDIQTGPVFGLLTPQFSASQPRDSSSGALLQTIAKALSFRI